MLCSCCEWTPRIIPGGPKYPILSAVFSEIFRNKVNIRIIYRYDIDSGQQQAPGQAGAARQQRPVAEQGQHAADGSQTAAAAGGGGGGGAAAGALVPLRGPS